MLVGVLLFKSVGEMLWLRAWLFLATWSLFVAPRLVVIYIRDPELLDERGKWKPDTKPFDSVFLYCLMALFYAMPIIAGLDVVRFAWSSLPTHFCWLGLGLIGGGESIVLWAMLNNTHFESTVRIQHDRGHKVISSGPYRIVRHPGYVGAIMLFTGMPLALGSVWALAPVFGIVVLFVWRTAREDATLRMELPGYLEYCEKTRFRLVPRVW